MPKSKPLSVTVLKTVTEPPDIVSVGPPHVPALYGIKPRKEYLPWSHAQERLEGSRNYWICTVRPDGRPHSIPVWGFWIDDALYFGTAQTTRKARNLSHNPAVSVHLESGDDVIILEGNTVEINDKAVFKKIDASCRTKYKMPLMIIPESVLYCLRPRVVLAWKESDFPGTGTRWEFSRS
ncbi:MAG TPA: pyridoxamine 5'-phosphate oxidase family protein [Terriglobales bacterium]|nr:pyridoxamine 5'-phosphate oxidase family protein [Terriglobales bacterium]